LALKPEADQVPLIEAKVRDGLADDSTTEAADRTTQADHKVQQ
jgi:hypothetical protein